MLEEENTALKNKIVELKQRLNQIYTESFMNVNKSRVFENEFSLYLKACEHARNERGESIKQQSDVIKIGLTVLITASALTVYVFNMYIFFGMLILLGLGFLACGFMYLLLNAEIRIIRAGNYCTELETYFKNYRWSTGQNERLNLPTIPLWDEYRFTWDKDLFDERHFGETALYAPFRIAITLIDSLAIMYVIYSFIARHSEISWIVLIVSCIVWVVSVTLQMFLVHSIINKVGIKLAGGEKDRLEEFKKGKGISLKPMTRVNILRLFFILDIIYPKELKKS
ncbi:MAG: hypothetical protein OEZ33_07975 [Gammaproteobacteria bacterium]|nr:hypothetical protein [Nitrospirota bacterium]MDH5778133.1 hypothetical protein [Gammaproteobacteria bacterium]